MKRNKNVEAMRGIAILCMIIYHYRLSISGFSFNIEISVLIEMLGQFALITFFIISGFGTYMWFYTQELNGQKAELKTYIKKRFCNLAPPYYTCLIILLLFTPNILYLCKDKLYCIAESFLFIHNFDVSNSLNGVTWTISTIVQLYMFSGILYKLLCKWGIRPYPILMLTCILIKKIISGFIIKNQIDSIWLVIVGIRIPFFIVDIFFSGMCSAYMCIHYKEKFSQMGKKLLYTYLLSGIVLYITFFYFFSAHIGIYGNSLLSCMSQSLMGLVLGGIIFIVANQKFSFESVPGKMIQFMAHNEYCIFLWHMIFMGNILTYSPDWYIWLNQNNPFILLIILILAAIIWGYIFNKLMSKRYITTNK